MTPHLFATRIYYDDTDASGYVYHSNYLVIAERARSTLLYDSGVTHQDLLHHDQAAFVVKSLTIDFHKPGKLDDSIHVHTHILELKGASVTLSQKIYRKETLLATLTLKLALVNGVGKPLRFPSLITTAFKKWI